MKNNNDQKLAARIGRLQLVLFIFRGLTYISAATFVLGIIAAITDSPRALSIILYSFAAIIVCLGVSHVFAGKIKNHTTGDIMDILREVFQDFEYQVNGCIARWRVEESQLVAGWNEISGGDLVTGKYKGCPIEFSDIKLENVYVTYDNDGDHTTERNTIFSGQWIVCETGCELAEPVYLWEKERTDPGYVPPRWHESRGYIETENTEFNNRFEVESADPQSALCILTPQFMEYLCGNKYTGIRIRRFIIFYDNYMQCALYGAPDMFEVNRRIRNAEDIARLRKQIRSEVENITGILDQIMLNEYLFPPAPGPELPPAQ